MSVTQRDLARRIAVWQITRAGKRDGDGDGFVDDGTPQQRPAPPKVAKPKPKPTADMAGFRRALRAENDRFLEATLRAIDGGSYRFPSPAVQAAARRAVLAEMARRDREARKARDRMERFEKLLAERPDLDEVEAWAMVTGEDPDKLRRKMERSGRPTVAQMRADWDLVVEVEFLEAERVARGHLVTPEGRARGINPRDFWRRPAAFVNRWASEEFKRWAAERGGMTTWALYRTMVEGGDVREGRTRASARYGEFG